ncbi:MAG: cell division topological specificity factor MinE [Anaerolineae bacterium]
MTGFFDRMLGRGSKDEHSASTAKERLQFVLVHDRINLPPERLKEMKEELLQVISKYVAVSSDKVEIALEQRDRENNLIIAEIPFSKSLTSQHPERDDNDDLPGAQ